MTSQKDFELLIRAFKYVRTQIKARLVIAGTGPNYQSLISLRDKLNLENDVVLPGFVDSSEEIIASSDVFVMTSLWEGFPATLVESMVLGTPIVSVNCESGPAELIRNGVTGILVDSRLPDVIRGRR